MPLRRNPPAAGRAGRHGRRLNRKHSTMDTFHPATPPMAGRGSSPENTMDAIATTAWPMATHDGQVPGAPAAFPARTAKARGRRAVAHCPTPWCAGADQRQRALPLDQGRHRPANMDRFRHPEPAPCPRASGLPRFGRLRCSRTLSRLSLATRRLSRPLRRCPGLSFAELPSGGSLRDGSGSHRRIGAWNRKSPMTNMPHWTASRAPCASTCNAASAQHAGASLTG